MGRSVFVSYSLPDRDCAFELVARLEAAGVSAWIAPRDISPAADWAAEIIEAISTARLMVLVFSSHSNASPQVRREVERAVHKELPILPFRIEDIIPSKSLEYFLSSQHWLDAFPPPFEPHYERVCRHVSALLNCAPATAQDAAATTATQQALPAMPAPGAVAAAGAPASFPPEQLASLERQLAQHIGPLAQHLVRRAATRFSGWEPLVTHLAGEIDAPPARRQFLDACHSLGRQGH
ncbi:MAG: toll/interleukin-1 receptor domain-containing protein [Proteobacteria bacterium]|nr:toll/interleukin-1 receptor domain-containing protein [Pseudomonadota bacterium]